MGKHMRAATAVSALLVAALATAAWGAIPGASGTLWVTERAGNTVTAFDAATGAVLGTTPVGAAPIGITRPHGTDKVYSSDENAHQLSVIARDTITLLKKIQMPPGSRPHHLMASPNGKYVYVAEFGWNQIGVVDTDTDTRVAGLLASASPAARTHAVWVSNNNQFLYAANSVANTVAKLDAQTGEILWELPVGNNPSEVLVTANDKLAFVSVRNENKIKIVDTTIPALVAEQVIGAQPDTLQLTNDGEWLVVGLRGTPATMALMNTETLAVREVPLTGTTTGHQWLSANSRYTFIAVESPGGVAVVDNRAGEQIAFYPYPGGPRPHGVFYEPSVLR